MNERVFLERLDETNKLLKEIITELQIDRIRDEKRIAAMRKQQKEDYEYQCQKREYIESEKKKADDEIQTKWEWFLEFITKWKR